MQRPYGAVGTPSVGHHQWRLQSRRPLATGRGKFNRTARVMLYEMRWREPPPQHGLRIASATLSLLLHVLLAAGMLLVRPPAWAPPSSELPSTVEVRLIDEQKPPPPPPPIQLRRLPTPPTATRVPTTVKEAPVAAMPPVPTQPTPPQVEMTLQRPQVTVAPGAPQPPQRVAASPEQPEQPAPAAPPPPKVVLEPSEMALPPPVLEPLQVQPAKRPSPRLQPVPATAPATAEVGAPQLQVEVPLPQPASAQPVQRPQAVPPTPLAAVPAPDTAPPRVTLTPPPTSEVPMPPPTLQRPNVEPAPLAPIPQALSAAPELQLPVADVPEPQAPRNPAPVVAPALPAPAVVAAEPAPSATAATSVDAQANAPAPSWARSDDQFEPLPRHGDGEQGGQAGDGQGQGGEPGGYVQLYPRGNSDVMGRRSSRIDYKPTIFSQYWASANESALDSWLRHFVEKFTVKHTFHLAPGVRVHCALGPLAIFLACGGDAPDAASTKSNDPRLNMAPAQPLVSGLASPGEASTAPTPLNNQVKCEVARVAGGPPPPGCPGAPPSPSQSDQW